MRRPHLAALAGAAALALTTLALAPSAGAAPSPNAHAPKAAVGHRQAHVCASPGPDHVSCNAIRNDPVAADGTVVPQAVGAQAEGTPVAGSLGPADIQAAYNLAGTSGAGRTVAIVDAYDDPTAEADLANYRSFYGLGPANFRKVGQSAGSALPAVDAGWAQEISLDLDMVSATCPDCSILLVETNSASYADLSAGVAYAASLGVAAISNSYGGGDTRGSSYPAYQNAAAAGIAVTASTGDSGYGAQSPATFTGVVAVGGTSLTRSSAPGRGWTETAWSGAGSGCSRYNAKPTYQSSATKCSAKADADVSAVADPNTGVAVYDSTAYQGASGWMQFGGTSASSPIIASIYALAGNISKTQQAGQYTWSHAAGHLNDVTSGSNGRCLTRVLCTAGAGWDGPTGLGTPNGTAAF